MGSQRPNKSVSSLRIPYWSSHIGYTHLQILLCGCCDPNPDPHDCTVSDLLLNCLYRPEQPFCMDISSLSNGFDNSLHYVREQHEMAGVTHSIQLMSCYSAMTITISTNDAGGAFVVS